MATAKDILFLQRTTRRVAKAGLRKVRPRIRESSRTLARAVHVLQFTPEEAWVFLPHYWALPVHDGRRPFTKSRVMVWFKNPGDDPRLRGGTTPPRVSQLRSLTREQFFFWLGQNRLADPTGRHPDRRPMIVTRRIRKPTQANRFFDNKSGMLGFPREASTLFQEAFSRHIADVVLGVPKELTDEIVASIG